MTLSEFDEWIGNEMPPIKPKGRIGQLLLSELNLKDIVNLAFEWDLSKESPTIIFGSENSSEKLKLRGWIDRVDFVPFEDGTLINEKGNILGMMPHPERATDKTAGLIDGEKFFTSILESIQ